MIVNVSSEAHRPVVSADVVVFGHTACAPSLDRTLCRSNERACCHSQWLDATRCLPRGIGPSGQLKLPQPVIATDAFAAAPLLGSSVGAHTHSLHRECYSVCERIEAAECRSSESTCCVSTSTYGAVRRSR